MAVTPQDIYKFATAKYGTNASQMVQQGINQIKGGPLNTMPTTNANPIISGQDSYKNKMDNTGITNPYTGKPTTTTTTSPDITKNPINVSAGTQGPATQIKGKDIYGDYSQKPTVAPMTQGLDIGGKTIQDINDINTEGINPAKFNYGQNAIQSGTDLNQRNSLLGAYYAKQGLTDPNAIYQDLNKQQSFAGMPETDKLNTAKAIASRIGQFGNWESVLNQASQQAGFKDANDLRAKTGNNYEAFKQSYLNALQDPNQLNAFVGMLGQQVGQNAQLVGLNATNKADIEALKTNFGVSDRDVLNDSTTVTNLLNQGMSISQIAGTLGQPEKYVTDMLQGKIADYTKLSPEAQTEVTKYIDMQKSQLDIQQEQQKRDIQNKQNTIKQSYDSDIRSQQEINKIQDENMSHIARMTGIGMSSSGLEGMDYVHNQGLKAIDNITKNFDNNNMELNNALTDSMQAYQYNLKLYDMKAQDSIKDAKNAFFNNFQNIQAKFGSATNQTYQAMQELASNYLKEVNNINQQKVDNSLKQAQLLQAQLENAQNYSMKQKEFERQQKYQTAQLGMQQQQMNRPEFRSENGVTVAYDPNTGQQINIQPSQVFNSGNTTKVGASDRDIDTKVGDPIPAPVGGKILAINKNTPGTQDGNIQLQILDENGKTVTLNHLDPQTLYSGLSVGSTIKKGDIVAIGGNTGNVQDINGNRLRKDGKVLDQASLDKGLGSHLDVRVKGETGQQTQNYLENQPEIDPKSQEILGQTGLGIDAFSYLTQGTTALSRLDAKTRATIKKEAEEFARSKGIDISTFRSQYEAINEAIQRNVKISSNVQRDEMEIKGTLENLMSSADENAFSNIKRGNLIKMFAGEEVNDPGIIEYGFQLKQLKSEIAGYFGALAGENQPSEADKIEAERVVINGLSSGGLKGLQNAMEKSVLKMGKNLPATTEKLNKQVRDLFGVGENYKGKYSQQEAQNEPITATTSFSKIKGRTLIK